MKIVEVNFCTGQEEEEEKRLKNWRFRRKRGWNWMENEVGAGGERQIVSRKFGTRAWETI